MAWLKGAPKDTIPIGKVPRKQKSSRFYAKENVELERLPSLKGKPFSYLTHILY